MYIRILLLFSPLLCFTQEIGYNLPAAVDLEKKWSLFFDASFTYWYAGEEGLTLADSALLQQGNVVLPQQAVSLGQPFEYQPGFQVGMGWIYDREWKVRSEYTWIRNQTAINQGAEANTSSVNGTGVWNVEDWFQQTIAFQEVNSEQGQSLSGTAVASQWHLAVDIADVDLGRPFYQGATLTLSPFTGLRAAWIRQSITVALTQAPGSVGGASYLLPQPIHSHNHSHCWGIGPRMGLEAHCMLPKGWRLEGKGAASLLATTFTTLSHREDAQSTAVTPGPYTKTQSDLHSLLPNGEMGLGIGWEMRGKQRPYHLDICASYDFSIFWGQNKIREMLDHFWAGTNAQSGNLFFHGLTLAGHVDY